MFQLRIEDHELINKNEFTNIEEETKFESNHQNSLEHSQSIDSIPSHLEFLTGNPRVEQSIGKLHLYRPNEYIHNNLDLPQNRGTLVCMIAIPEHMTPLDILELTTSFRNEICLIRMIQDPQMHRYMSLIQLKNQESADFFFKTFNGVLFNSMEQERCKLVFIQNVVFNELEHEHIQPNGPKEEFELEQDNEKEKKDDHLNIEKAFHIHGTKAIHGIFPIPPKGMTEIPTCAVCLERLDESASGVLTTMCNHTFHCDCLFRWEGSNCPVCRYSHGDIQSACEVCGNTEHLWICLICGHIGCGRYSGEHAKKHYHETKHTYSLELETQRVWDYAGDGYVHRLILNKQDGKCVEFPNPNRSHGERSQIPPLTDAEQEEGDHRKLEKLSVEYNFLLTSQLEEQRLYYERRIAELTHSTDPTPNNASIERERRTVVKKNAALMTKMKSMEEEVLFLKELNRSLLSNQKQYQNEIQQLRQSTEEKEKRIQEAEAQVRDLMFYLDTQNKIENSPHRQELQDGQLQVHEVPNGNPNANGGNRGKRRASKKKSRG